MFELELNSKSKLLDVYKESADIAERKVIELNEAFENVQQLFDQSKQG